MTRDDIAWFKQQFAGDIATAIAGTPLTLDLLTAIACQETGHIWASLRATKTVPEVLALCVGDIIDAPGRRAFPKTRAELLTAPDGAAMFTVGRSAFEEMARVVPGFRRFLTQPHKFCRGYGIFQLDLQHFRSDPGYFLERRYVTFPAALAKCLGELRRALAKNGLAARPTLTDMELASVAITYNAGSFKPERGLLQGHFDGTKFYGQHVMDFLRLSQSVPEDGAGRVAPPPAGRAPVPPPTAVTGSGTVLEVDVRDQPLRVRRTPEIADGNVIARLPDGHRVRAVAARASRGFLEIETSLNGAHVRGFASREFLRPVANGAEVTIARPAAAAPTSGIVAVEMPRRAGTVTRRADLATAHSLNEAGQPSRRGTTPDALRAEIDAIVEWLAVDKPAHRRYQPRDGQTFCNIYAHDFCHLAGVYLPRVWWTPAAIEALARGEAVAPRFDQTIREMRANDLALWLRDFGLRFGWRQTGTATKLQLEVNQGAIGLVIARRRDDGRPGHVTVALPETVDATAKRAPDGEVIAPLQSQAGTSNFRRKPGTPGWWLDPKFAEHAFWLHA